MPLSAGEQLGHYKILSMIGKGGMGEVYLATDMRLDRSVAIKFSSREFNDRFEREAKAISTLNHPNICTLHDIGPNYLVMEYIEGETLSKLIERGPLPLEKALQYAVQIVDALAAAHAKGVIHRDLKPGNVIITRNGAKVLDFGLAKVSTEKISPESAVNIQTVTEPITRAGAILGTLYYMAPEQVEGKDTDERSDIFSFGVVFYEMITGQRPFNGDTQAAVLAALLKDQPAPMNQRQPAVPRALERVVRKCLEKKPDDRWHSARDLKPTLELIDLDAPPSSMSSASASIPIPVQTPARKPWLWPSIGAVALVAIAAAAWVLWPKPALPARATRFQVTLPPDVQFNTYVSLSPDGHKLVFTATGEKDGLWIRDLDTLEWRRLAGTEGAVAPFWSPDSRYLGFGVRNDLKKIEVAGGPVQTLCTVETQVGTGTWNREGVILFGTRGTNDGLRRVSAAGGVPSFVTAVDHSRGASFHALPFFLKDGKHFVYLQAGGAAGIYAGSLDAKPEAQPKERILATTIAAPYVDGNLFFLRGDTLMVQPFDDSKLQLLGEPAPVAEHVGSQQSGGFFSVSPAGVLAYRTGVTLGAGVTQLTWFDLQGKVMGAVGGPVTDRGLVLSPDATRAAGRDVARPARGDIWLMDFAREVRTRLTFRQSDGSQPVWSPDGGRIIFSAGESGLDGIYEKAASGAGEEKEILKNPGKPMFPTSWSRDGRFLLYTLSDGGAPGSRTPVPLLATQFNEAQATFSPDGRWIAYRSNETGTAQVYVRPFVSSSSSGSSSGPSFGGSKWQASKDGGQRPQWRADGKQLIFEGLNRQLIAVDVSTAGAALQLGTPRMLFTLPPNNGWDMAGDGKRVLIRALPGQQTEGTQTPITVVLNWQADLKK